ncbi:hypothetical protein HDU78_002653 [Chytriomyces hyalinus]|nr:hypothetical protein HDU78_002653 [Chytriomyces hyalinus]
MAEGVGISRYMAESLRVTKALQAFLIARQQCEAQYATSLAEACYTLKGAADSKIDTNEGKIQNSPLKQAINDLVKGVGKIADARYAFAGTMKKTILDPFASTINDLQSTLEAQLDEMEHMQDPLIGTFENYKKVKTVHDANKLQVQEAKEAIAKAQQENPQKKKDLEKLNQKSTAMIQKAIQSNQSVAEALSEHDAAREFYLKEVLPSFQKALIDWDETRLNCIKQMLIEIKHLEQIALEKAVDAKNVGKESADTIDVQKIVSKFVDTVLMRDIEVRKASATSVRDLRNPSKVGTLYLKRNDSPLSPWSVQYMVLKNNRLYVFDTAEADQPREVIALNRLLPDNQCSASFSIQRSKPKLYTDRVTSDFAIIHTAHQSLFQKASVFQLLFHSNSAVTSFSLEESDLENGELNESSSIFYPDEDDKSMKDLRSSLGKRSMLEASVERPVDRRYYFMPVEKDPTVTSLWLNAFEQNGAQTCWCGTCIPGASSLTLKLSIIEGSSLGVERGANDSFGVMVKFGNLKMGRTAFKQGPNPFWNEEFTFEHVTACTNTIKLSVNSGLNLDNGDSESGFLFFSIPNMSLERRIEATTRLMSSNQSVYDKSANQPTLKIAYLLTTGQNLDYDEYSDFIQLLITPPLDTFHFLSNSLPHDHRDEFYDTYLNTLMALNDPVLPAICSLIEREISNTDDPNILFRGNSVLTKILERFMRIVGSDYVKETIGACIASIFQLCGTNGMSFEIDPNRIPQSEDVNPADVLQENWKNLLQQVELIWSSISVSFDKCPVSLKVIFSRMKGFLKSKYSEEKYQHIGISGFIFLRLFCVAILAPKRFGIVAVDPDAQTLRTLTLITKIMQHLANFSHFGAKERHMELSNEWINANTAGMKSFINEISSLPGEATLPNTQPCLNSLIPVSILYRFLSSQAPSLSTPSNLSNPVCKVLLSTIDALDTELEQKSKELLALQDRRASALPSPSTPSSRPASSPMPCRKFSGIDDPPPPVPPIDHRRTSELSHNPKARSQPVFKTEDAQDGTATEPAQIQSQVQPDRHSTTDTEVERPSCPTGATTSVLEESPVTPTATSTETHSKASSHSLGESPKTARKKSRSVEHLVKSSVSNIIINEAKNSSRKGSIQAAGSLLPASGSRDPASSSTAAGLAALESGTGTSSSPFNGTSKQGLSGFMSRFKNSEPPVAIRTASASSTESTTGANEGEKQFTFMNLIGGAKNYITTSPRLKKDSLEDDCSVGSRKATITRAKEADEERREMQSSKNAI